MIRTACGIGACERRKQPWQFCCPFHWRRLPKALRDEIWRTYKLAAGSAAHLAALDEGRRVLEAADAAGEAVPA